MAKTIQSMSELKRIFGKIAKESIEEVTEKAYELLQKYISEQVYGGHTNREYANGLKKPTGQFAKAFEMSDIKQTATEVTRTLWYNFTTMDTEAPHNGFWGIHAGLDGEDSRENLASYLNTSGYPGASPVSRQPYWDSFLLELESNYKDWFYEAFNKRGFDIKKYGIISLG